MQALIWIISNLSVKRDMLIIYLLCCKLTCIVCKVSLLQNYSFVDLFSMNQIRQYQHMFTLSND